MEVTAARDLSKDELKQLLTHVHWSALDSTGCAVLS